MTISEPFTGDCDTAPRLLCEHSDFGIMQDLIVPAVKLS